MTQISTLGLLMGSIAGQVLFESESESIYDPYSDETVYKAEYTLPVDSGPDAMDMVVRGPAYSRADGMFGSSALYVPVTYNSTSAGCLELVDPLPLGTNDFTIEFFAKFPTPYELSSGDTLVACTANNPDVGWAIKWDATNYNFLFEASDNGTSATKYGSFYLRTYSDPLDNDGVSLDTVFDGNYHHFAVVRNGTSVHVYIDGVQGGDVGGDPALPGAFDINSSADCRVRILGRGDLTTNPQGVPEGSYMDELRITVGTARYTSAFTPPSAVHATGGSDPNWSDVKLLCRFNSWFGTSNTGRRDGNFDVVESTGALPTIDADGLVCLSNFTAAAISHEAWSPWDSDFTLEAWGVSPGLTHGGYNFIAGHYAFASGRRSFGLAIVDTSNEWGLVYTLDGSSSTIVASSGETLTNDVAYDLAVERDGSNFKFYQDGTLVNTVAVSGSGVIARNTNSSIFNTNTENSDYNDDFFTGRIGALRYTKGVARYTADALVAAPTLPLPPVSPPVIPTGASHKNWRVKINTNTTGRDEIDELEFRTVAGVAEQATGGYANANNQYGSGYSADQAFDGSTASKAWLANDAETQEPRNTIGYAFASARNVVEVAITAETGNEAPRTFDVQFSDDGYTWATKWSVTTGTWTDGETKVFTAS